MPIGWYIDSARRRACLTMTDPYTLEQWESAVRLILQHPDVRPGFHFLIDRRDCSAPSTAFVRGAMNFLVNNASRVGDARAAAVVKNEPTAFGMVRMAELMAESSGLPVSIYTCTTMEDAERWLGGLP